MTRKLKEWIGLTDDTPAPPRVRLRIILAQDGICACGCAVKLGMAGEPVEIDHTVALINGGENRETNLRALRKACHAQKTRADVAEKAKVDRVRKKAMALVKTRNPLPGSRDSEWKRKIDGSWVKRK